MNIETLAEHIKTFERYVNDSGFKRDLDDFASSLAASQNNILALRDVAGKIHAGLQRVYESDLPEGLLILMPAEKVRPFTEERHDESFQGLIDDKEIQQAEFFNRLNQLLSQLRQQLGTNVAEVKRIQTFIEPFVAAGTRHRAEGELALISIVFREKETTSSLKQFTNTIRLWNRALPIYHQLLKSAAPKDIELVEVQNGSIDFVVNLNVDVAMDLVELFKVGFKVFAAYLAYKKMAQPIIESYHGNKKLIQQEEEREKLMLENVGEAVYAELESQHARAKKADKKVDGTAIDKKVEQVADLVTAHIVNGNGLVLLDVPASDGDDAEEDGKEEKKEELRQHSSQVRRDLADLLPEDRTKLLEMYGTPEIKE